MYRVCRVAAGVHHRAVLADSAAQFEQSVQSHRLGETMTCVGAAARAGAGVTVFFAVVARAANVVAIYV